MISIHQSQFLPWIPYFYKIIKSDIFVILDDVQFQKNGVQNRNQIKTPRGKEWVTVPIKVHLGEKINEVKIADQKSPIKLLKTIELNYKKSFYFNEVFAPIKDIFLQSNSLLNELNIRLLKQILKMLDIKTKIIFSSEMKLTQKNDDLVIEIIKACKETDYLSGKGAFDYMDFNKFNSSGINIYTYDFKYQPYKQLWEDLGFIPDLSIIDLMFNNLDASKGYVDVNGNIKEISKV